MGNEEPMGRDGVTLAAVGGDAGPRPDGVPDMQAGDVVGNGRGAGADTGGQVGERVAVSGVQAEGVTHVQPFLAGMEGEERRRDLSQFYTPAWLAKKVWDWSPKQRGGHPSRVLEPAAGLGALIAPMLTCAMPPSEVVAYDVDPGNVMALAHVSACAERTDIIVKPRDFLADADPGRFSLALQNPPYENDQDVEFIEHALDCAPVTIGIFRAALVYGQKRWDRLWRWHDIRREAVLSARPDFGGDHSPKTDFSVLEVQRRSRARGKGDTMTTSREWW